MSDVSLNIFASSHDWRFEPVKKSGSVTTGQLYGFIGCHRLNNERVISSTLIKPQQIIVGNASLGTLTTM